MAQQCSGWQRSGLSTQGRSDYAVRGWRWLSHCPSCTPEFEFINLGGGIGIPYGTEDTPVDLKKLSQMVRSAMDAQLKLMPDMKEPKVSALAPVHPMSPTDAAVHLISQI